MKMSQVYEGLEEITEQEAKRRTAVAKMLIAETELAFLLSDGDGCLAEPTGPRADPRPVWHSKHGWLTHLMKQVQTLAEAVEAGDITRGQAAAVMGRDIDEVDTDNERDTARQLTNSVSFANFIDEITTKNISGDGIDDDFKTLEPLSWVEMPDGYTVDSANSPDFVGMISIMGTVADDLGTLYFTAVPHEQIAAATTTAKIEELLKNGDVTLTDDAGGIEIDGERYLLARSCLEIGAQYPYDSDDEGNGVPAADWAHSAARGIITDLRDRGGLDDALHLDEETRQNIIDDVSDIIRAAFIRRAA
jgi:hypothetical protein